MRTQSGFTLFELMFTIAIGVLVLTLAVPSFRQSIQSAQRRQAATDFYSSLTRARSEAITRNTPVRICARDLGSSTPDCASSGSPWQNGWIVYAGSSPTTPIELHEGLADGFSLTGVTSPLEFLGSGRTGSPAQFVLCKGSGDTQRRLINVSASGRVALEVSGSC